MGKANGQLIVAGPEAVCKVSGSQLTPLPGTEPLLGKVVRSILAYKGLTLFVTNNDGVLAYDGERTMPFELPISGYLRDNQVFCAAIDGDVIAFGTVRGGMVLYDMKNDQRAYSNVNSWLQNNTVLSMMFDHNHNLWLGLDNGLSYVMREAPYTNILSSNSHIGTGYAAVITDRQLYLGTSQGLFVTPYPIAVSPTPPQPQLLKGMTGQVWSLTEIDGTLFCCSDNGTYIVRGMTAEHISNTVGTWKVIPLPQRPDCLIGCDYTGFFVLQRQGNTYRQLHRIKGIDVVTGEFLVDEDGTLWVSHWQKGVYHIQLSDDLTKTVNTEFFNKGHGLLMDEGNLLCSLDGQVYVSCVDGFYSYDRQTHQLVHAKEKNDIFATYGTPLRISRTPKGDLWAYKQNFLALAKRTKDGKYHVDSLSFRHACPLVHVPSSSLCYPDAGHTLICANEGFLLFNNQYHDKSQPALTYVRRVTSTNDGETQLYLNLTNEGEESLLRIPHTQNSIRIEFIETEFRDARAVTYQYKLDGYDHDWSTPQRGTLASYAKLPKGSYTFHVRALNALRGTSQESTLRIEVLPAWYETWWAYAVYTLLAVLTACGVLRYMKRWAERELVKVKAEQQRQLKEQQQQFSLEQAERERELIKLRAEQLEYDMKANASKLADSTMNLMRKNDMLLALDTQMNDLSESVRHEDAKASITKKIKDIRRNIQQNINEDDNWEKFEENFNLVYDNYMRKLTARFPDLKLNDRKLCAYLRMGLSSKEMASLLNTSTRSIETARYRLRKKLQMESGENLKDFIQSFED